MKTANIERSLRGIVIQKTTGQYRILVDGRTITCPAAFQTPALFRNRAKGNGNKAARQPEILAVGDEVFLRPTGGESGVILEMAPRRNHFSRRSAVPMPGAHASEQVIAANVDLVVPVFAVSNPQPHWNMLDRYLASAEINGLPALICITKGDLLEGLETASRADLENELADYRRIGYPVHIVSALSGDGLEGFRQALRDNRSVLLGKSGVGKTSLLNALQPGLGLRVNAVNQVTGNGRHTTTTQEMFLLDQGGAIVDTPGEREFGLWDIAAEDLAWCFREMQPFIGLCRFGITCQHDEEPGCAIRKAAMAGQISPRRYQSYLRMRYDL